MSQKVLLVLVDALKSNYLTNDNMPFLWNMAKKGVYIKRVIASPGFCERSEIFTGLDCFETGNFTAIGFLPEYSPYKNHKKMLKILDVFSKISDKYTRAIFRKIRIKKEIRLNHYLVPFRSLSNFALTEDGAEKMVPCKTIFDSIKDSGMTYTMDYFTALSDLKRRCNDSLEVFVKKNVEKGINFIPVYIGIIDGVGHRYGSKTEAIKPYLQKVDNKLKELYEISTIKGYTFAILGDHGMIPVKQRVDVKAAIKKLKYSLHKDYEMFLDSNMARFWFFNLEARKAITTVMKEKFGNYGTIITKENYKEYRIPMDIVSEQGKPVYGDLLWCASAGVLISPDFFHPKKASENGMHGYLNSDMEHGTGLFVAVGEGVKERVTNEGHLTDICGELCDLLQIERPNKEWERKLS